MTPKETTLESGLVLVETPPEPPPSSRKKAKTWSCAVCKKESAEEVMPLSWKTGDGFRIEWPTCKHGKFATCDDCYENHGGKTMGCPVCGSHEFYT